MTGRTFPLRAELQKAGALWDAEAREWLVDDDMRRQMEGTA